MDNKEPYTGIFIRSQNIQNDGDIISTGKNSVVDIETKKYVGNGTIQRHDSNSESKGYFSWFGQLLITVIGGLVVVYIAYRFGWQGSKL